MLKDNLPDRIIFHNDSLKIDNVIVSGNIFSDGLAVGNIAANQKKSITYKADLTLSDKFSFGQTQLTNTVLVYNDEVTQSATANVTVNKKAVAGATSVSTGLTNNIFLDSFFLPFLSAILIVFLLKSRLLKIEEWYDLRKNEYRQYRSKKILQFEISKIKTKEFFHQRIF